MSIFEGFVFAGTDWNDHTNFIMQDFDPGIAPKRWQWISGADSDGALPVEEAHYDNAEMTFRLRIAPQASMDAALAKIGTLVQALQEAEQQPAVWTPAASTKSLTAYVVGGEVTGIPLTMSGDDAGWFLRNPAPVVNIKLYRRPFLYGAEVLNAATVTNSLPYQVLTIGPWTPASIAGLELWLDPAQISGVTTDGTAISSWTDLSGTAHHFIQGTGANQPVLKTNIVNGKPVVRFDGVNDDLGCASFPADSSRTIFIVAKQTSTTDQKRLLTISGNTSSIADVTGNWGWISNAAAGNVSFGGAATNSGYSVITVRVNSLASLDGYVNGGTSVNLDPNDSVSTLGCTIGSNGGGSSFWDGDVAYVLSYNTALSNTDVDTVRNFLGATFNLGFGSIPAGTGLGDVPGEARLVVTDGATQSRRHLEWGLEWRYYNSATSLYVDSDNMVTAGFGGTGTTRAGADDPNAVGNSVIRGTLTTTPVAICGTGNLSHVGTFRVKARVFANPLTVGLGGANCYARLSWREGDGALRSNSYVPIAMSFPTAYWQEIDLGTISIPEKTLGTQRWTGVIEAYTGNVAGDTLDIDYLLLFPVGEGYGKARAPFAYETVTSFSARDEFDQTAGALAGKTPAVGAAWAGVGDADDFAVETAGHTAQRSVTADSAPGFRANTAGASITDQIVQVDWKFSTIGSDFGQGLVARFVDVSNLVYLQTVPGFGNVTLYKRVVGADAILATTVTGAFPVLASTWYTFRLLIDAAGRFAAWAFATGSVPGSPILIGQDTALATGGALASGKGGIRDTHTGVTVTTRNYDNFVVAVPTVDAAVFSGRSAEIRSDSAIRQDSTGTYYGPISSYRGARFYVPAAGSAGRTTRVIVKARRNDIDVMQDDQIADSTTAAVHYTPRFLVAPR